MDLLLSNLKSPVTDSIIDTADSPDWQSDITWCFFLLFLTGSKGFTNNVFQVCGVGGRVGSGRAESGKFLLLLLPLFHFKS